MHLRWKPAFACGHAEIDKEHEKLFDLANTLLDTAEHRDANPAAFEAAFDSLLSHVAEHFAYEESVLQAHGCVDLVEHAQTHRALLERARSIHAAAHMSNKEAVDGLVQFLVSELVAGHILGADRAFATLFSTPS